MSAFEKLKTKFMQQPVLNNITAEEVKSFLKHYGFIEKHINGSHFIYGYMNDSREIMLNIPMHSPIKPTYIKHIRKAILEIEGGNDE